jgi:hypothetical protein
LTNFLKICIFNQQSTINNHQGGGADFSSYSGEKPGVRSDPDPHRLMLFDVGGVFFFFERPITTFFRLRMVRRMAWNLKEKKGGTSCNQRKKYS